MTPDRIARAATRGSGRVVALALAAAALAHAPLLFLHGLFWDDWTWLWTHRTGGADAIADAMWRTAHPGYAPVFNAIFAYGGGEPGRLARAVALAFHLLNGVLLWRALDRPATRDVAAPAAAIFLVAPWFTARGTLAHAQYDVFLAAGLASILLSGRAGLVARAAALALQLVALSLETLAALEILRLVHLRRENEGWRAVARRAWPFWAIAATVALLRLAVVVPHGPWAEYNAVRISPAAWLPDLAMHLRFLGRAVGDAATQALRLAGPFGLAAALAAAAGAAAIASRGPARRSERPRVAAFAGVALALGGAVPYALAGHYPWTAHFGSRFAFVSQLGAALLVAAAIAAVKWPRARAAALAALVTTFALATAQNGKALLFDEAVQDALRRALEAEFAGGSPRTVLLRLEPPTRRALYRGRCFSANDLNVARALAAGGAAIALAYDADCVNPGEGARATPPVCTVAGLDSRPCPAPIEARVFALAPAGDDVRKLGLAALLRAAAGGAPAVEGALRPG